MPIKERSRSEFNYLSCFTSYEQENVLAESVAMVHDTNQRLKTAVKDLEEFMVSFVKAACLQQFRAAEIPNINYAIY
jgi:hypothetical protein